MSCEAPWERSTFFRPADRSWSPRTFLLLILMFFAWWVWGSVTLYCKRQTLSQRLICLRGDDLCLLVWIEAHLLCLAKWACASETFMTPMNVFFRLVRALLPQTPQLLPASSSGTCTASATAEQKPCTPPDVIFVCNDCLELNNLSDGGCGARLWQRNTSSHCLSLTCFLLEHVRYETKEKSLVAFWECTTLILIFPIALQQKNNGCLWLSFFAGTNLSFFLQYFVFLPTLKLCPFPSQPEGWNRPANQMWDLPSGLLRRRGEHR